MSTFLLRRGWFVLRRGWLATSILLICTALNGQNQFALPAAYRFNGDANAITSNVPLNEINVHAFRHFQKRFPAVSAPSWIKTEDGYIVSFTEKGLRNQAHFDQRGTFLFSLKYYAGDGIDRELGAMIRSKYPGYFIKVVTEITNGEKVFYLVAMENGTSVKTLSVGEGGMDISEVPVNGIVAR
jgi:hypothetical protein